MTSPLATLESAFKSAIAAAFDGLEVDAGVVPSQSEQFGDYQCSAAMGLAKRLKLKPRDVAAAILAKLDLSELVATPPDASWIAGPGFINVRLSDAWLSRQLSAGDIGLEKTKTPQTVVVDYSGVNIAKEMHVGHLRSTIIGDAIANVLEARGDKVIRRNHLGDWGTQFGMLIFSLMTPSAEVDKVGKLSFAPPLDEAASEHLLNVKITDLENFYRAAKLRFDTSPAFAEASRATVVQLQRGHPGTLEFWSQIVNETRAHYLPLYEKLGVRLRQEHERGESFYNDRLAPVVAELKEKQIAEESDGAIAVFVDGHGEGKAPLLIQKSDGGYLYGTTDLAAVQYRIVEDHATRIIYTHDSRQAQHFRQVFATADKAGWTRPGGGGEVSLEYAPFGTMLGEDGKPFKTRSGDTVKLKDLLDEAETRAEKVVEQKNAGLPDAEKKAIARAVGIGAVKYADLSKDRTSDYVFSWDKMLAMDGNTAPYLQYAYARIKSIFRKAGVETSTAAVSLKSPFEIALAKHLLRFGEVVDSVARELKPHLLCAYLYDLAARFSAFYENCPVLSSAEPERGSRLTLALLTARTLAEGLDLLGIEHPEQM